MMNRGFTLVEILVVIAITAIVGTIMVAIFSNTLRGSNKSQILAAIKQNGQAVLENMDKTIRNSGDVVCPQIIPPLTSASSDTLVVVKNGFYTRFKFMPPILTSNGVIQQDNPVQPTSGPESDNKVFLDNLCNVYTVPSPTVLTDTNSQSGVSANGLFTRNKQPGFKDSVTVAFTLGPGVGAPPVITGQIDPVAFQTTVQLR